MLFSVVGGLMGAGVLILLGHRLAEFASAFEPWVTIRLIAFENCNAMADRAS